MACPAIARPQPHKLTGIGSDFDESLQHNQATRGHLSSVSPMVNNPRPMVADSDGGSGSTTVMPFCSPPSFDPLVPNGWFLEQPNAHIQFMTANIEQLPGSDACDSSSLTGNIKIAKRNRPSRGYLAQFPKRKSPRLASQHASSFFSNEEHGGSLQDDYLPAPEPRFKFSPSHHLSVPGRSLLKQGHEHSSPKAPALASTTTSSVAHYNGIYSMDYLEKFIENRDMMQQPVYRYQFRKSAKKTLRWSDTLEW